VAQLRYAASKSGEDKSAWRQLKKVYNNLLILSKRNVNLNFISNATNRNKAAWQIINKGTGRSKCSSDLPISADCLHKYFLNSISQLVPSVDSTDNTAMDILTNFPGTTLSFKW
jgi:hypothetical protein